MVLPSWAYEADWVSITAHVKGRELRFEEVGIPKDIGAFVVKVDRLPFSEDVGWVVEEGSRATELYVIEVDQIDQDGEFYF